MKRLNPYERIAWLRLVQKRARKHSKRKLKLHSHKQSKSKKSRSKTKISNYITLKAPVCFELIHSKHHRKLMEFLEALRNNALIRKQQVKIDFSQTKRMVVCGTLLFYSELCRIQRELGSLDSVSCVRPSDTTVAQVLQHLGIFKMLNSHHSIVPERPDVINWKIAFGNNTDTTEAAQILEMQSKLPRAKSKKLYRGVSEAMTNVSQHAYMEIRNDGAEIANDKGWWMFCREEDDHIIVAFCDLGIGISETLPKTVEKNLLSRILQKLPGNNSDGKLIRAAIEVKRSRTNNRHRGKGLMDMIKAIDTTQGGRLVILSNKGSYRYNLNNSKPSEEIKNYKYSILGTLILWSLPLNSDTEVNT